MSPGIGIMASGKQIVGGGGPTTDIIESINVATTASGGVSQAISTSLLSTDRVVVVTIKSTTSGTPTPSGLGATWTNDVVNNSGTDIYVASASGVTGTGTVSVVGLGAADADVSIFVLRNSAGSAVVFSNGNGAFNSAASAGQVAITTAATAAAGAMVFGAAFVSNGAFTFPTSGSNPLAGWTVDRTGTVSGADRRRIMHQQMSAATSIQLGVSASAIAGIAVVRAAYL